MSGICRSLLACPGRRRDRGNDWISYRLVDRVQIRAIEIDTAYLKGNSAGWACASGPT